MRADVARADRQQPQRHVARELDQDAAGADQQQRAVERIAARADDRLDAGHHLLHQEAVDARVRMRCARRRQQRVGGGRTSCAAAQIEHDAAGLGLVQDVGRADFQRDRKSDRRPRPRPPRCALATARLCGSAMP